MEVVTLLIIFCIGTIVSIPLSKNKYTKIVPRPLVLIIIGAILAGSNNITLGNGYDSKWFDTPDIINPGSKINDKFFDTFATNCAGLLMFMAGFGLDLKKLSKMGFTSISMGIIPSLLEGIVAGSVLLGIMAIIDADLVKYWSFWYAAGFAIASAPTGIILPPIMRMKKQKYSEKSGINDSIIVGASLDNITSIAMFLVFFNMGVNNNYEDIAINPGGNIEGISPTWEVIIFQTPWLFIWSAIIGAIFGFIFLGIKKFIDQNIKNQNIKINDTTTLPSHAIMFFIIIVGLVSTQFFTSDELKRFKFGEDAVPGGSYFQFEFYLSTMMTGIIIAFWMNSEKQENIKEEVKKSQGLEKITNLFWIYFGMTIIFINTGANVDFRVFGNLYIFIPIVVIILGILARWVGVIICTYSKRYTWHERAFACIAFIPKGTSTAGAITYMQILSVSYGVIIPGDVYMALLTSAIVAIILTIPIAMPMIDYFGPKLLVKHKEEQKITKKELNKKQNKVSK